MVQNSNSGCRVSLYRVYTISHVQYLYVVLPQLFPLEPYSIRNTMQRPIFISEFLFNNNIYPYTYIYCVCVYLIEWKRLDVCEN